MAVRMEGRIGVVAHDRGDAAELAVHEVEALAPHTGAGAGLPRHGRGIHAGRPAEVGIQAVAHGRILSRIPAATRYRSGNAILHRKAARSEEHTSELQSLMRISYAVFCLK